MKVDPRCAPADPGGRICRSVLFAFVVALTLAVFWAPLEMLLRFSFRGEQYSHIVLIPLISGMRNEEGSSPISRLSGRLDSGCFPRALSFTGSGGNTRLR